MEVRAQLVDASRSLDGAFRLTFETRDDVRQFVDMSRNDDIRLKAVRWRERRSLNANAYFHVLVGKIAQKLSSSLTEVHNQLIAGYGQPDPELGHVILRADIDWSRLDTIHLRPTASTRILDNGETYRVYYVMRGSHTYDTAEMAALIDGAVYEAKELGIETMTPAELEEIKRLWGSCKTAGSASSAEDLEKSCTTASTDRTDPKPTKTA